MRANRDYYDVSIAPDGCWTVHFCRSDTISCIASGCEKDPDKAHKLAVDKVAEHKAERAAEQERARQIKTFTLPA